MKLLPLTTFLSIIAAVAAHAQAGGDAVDVLLNLKDDPKGFKHVGVDGIARSFDVNGTVIDSAKLTRSQLLGVAEMAHSDDERNHLQNIWATVDTSKVDDTQMWAPPQHVLPTRFANPKAYAAKIAHVDVDVDAYAAAVKQHDVKGKLQRRFEFCQYVKCAISFTCETFFTCGPCVEIVHGVGHCMKIGQ